MALAAPIRGVAGFPPDERILAASLGVLHSRRHASVDIERPASASGLGRHHADHGHLERRGPSGFWLLAAACKASSR